jgi:hypothetical protein
VLRGLLEPQVLGGIEIDWLSLLDGVSNAQIGGLRKQNDTGAKKSDYSVDFHG